MRLPPQVGVALISFVLAACGGSSSNHSTTSASSQGRPTRGSPSCHVLTAADFARIGASTPASVQHLANSTGQRRTCSDLFVDSSGGLILVITKIPGSARQLAAIRQSALAGSTGTRSRALPGIPGGYVAGQQAGFLQRGQVVTLSTGYTTTGRTELTTAQLVRLASLVAHR